MATDLMPPLTLNNGFAKLAGIPLGRASGHETLFHFNPASRDRNIHGYLTVILAMC